MNTIAMCVMKHNHPETVADVLMNFAKIFKACEIDVYYYDSSFDDRTLEIIDFFRKEGFDNISYIPCRGLSGDEKLGLLYTGKALPAEYDYYWVVKDRTACDASAILKIYEEALFEKPDIIVIDSYGEHKRSGSVTYDAPVSLYRDQAWQITSMDVCLFRKKGC